MHSACAVIYCHLVCLALRFVSTLCRQWQDFRKIFGKLNELKTFFIFFVVRRTERDIVINVHTSSSKFPIIFVIFQLNFNIVDNFSKNIHISNFMKIRSAGAEFFP